MREGTRLGTSVRFAANVRSLGNGFADQPLFRKKGWAGMPGLSATGVNVVSNRITCRIARAFKLQVSLRAETRLFSYDGRADVVTVARIAETGECQCCDC